MSTPAYQLRLDRPLDRDATRLFRAPIHRARRALRSPDDEAVHAARKAVKRARAVLRLVRGAIPPDRYRQLDRALRSVGRRTGPLRDAAVALDLTARLEADGSLGPGAAAPLRAHVLAARDDARRVLTERGRLETLQNDLGALRLPPDDVAPLDDVLALRAGLETTYARGRERLAQAAAAPSADALHAWRRQVKHHGYHIRLLVPAWPTVLRCVSRAADVLSDALGDDHDLAELARHAAQADLRRSDLRAVRALVRARREAIQVSVWPLGARVYAEEPAPFAARMTTYLAASPLRAPSTAALTRPPRVLTARP